METIAALALMSFALSASAQAPPTPPQPALTPSQQAIMRQAEPLQKRMADDYLQLKNLAVFQDYEDTQKQLTALQQQYTAAGATQTPAVKTAPPADAAPAPAPTK